MIDIMQQVVSRGTGTKAQIDDLPIAGKTGTTKKVRPDGTGYLQDEYLSSFGGFFPANDPKLTIFVLIDSPHGQYYGGDIAAPCFRQILQRIIKLESMSSFMDMAKNEPDAATKIILVPDLFKRQTAVAEQILKELELTPRISGTGEYVLAQVPAPGELVKVGTQVLLKLTRLPDDSCATRAVPEVRGSPIRDALIQFAAAGIEISVEGSGSVVWQDPKPGTIIPRGQKCKIKCEATLNLNKLVKY